MCRPARCPRCSRTTWAGCGQHVDQVMRGVPASERCTCRGDAAPGQAPATQKRGLRDLLRRR